MVCKGTKSEKIYSGNLTRCLDCGFVTSVLEMSEDEVNKLYSENYFRGNEYLDYVKDKRIIQKNFAKRLKSILRRVERETISSVLEIGCAYGFFGELIREVLPEATYCGLDISEDAVKYASEALQLDVRRENYQDHKPGHKYSDVFLWDVIEHLPRPDLCIKKAFTEIQPGGRLYITTGNIDAFIPRIRKGKWRMIHPPTHLHYFSARTLIRLLKNIGFNDIRITYPMVYRGLRQIFYSFFILRRKPGKWIRIIFDRIPETLTIPVNTFDIMFVQAFRK